MLTPSPLTLVLVAVVTAIVYVNYRRKWAYRLQGCRLPPGPRGWPILGSLLDLPNCERPWTIYRKWAQQYGDMIFLRVLNSRVILVSSAKIILELTEKRSAIYSDKPPLAIDDLTGWEFNLATMPYGNRWRSIRRMFHQYFNQTVTPNYRDKQTKEVYAFLRRCLEQPAGRPLDPLTIRLTLATIILDIVYGLQIESMDDEYIRMAIESMDAFSESRVSGRYWIDFMPFLRHIPSWVPGAAAVKLGARWHPVVEEMINKPFDAIKQQLDGVQTPFPSMALELITGLTREKEGDSTKISEEEQHARDATGIAYAAGADTTYSLIQTFFCCMASYPELQKRAREELDEVVGPDRLPTYEDYDSLPYIHAIFMECARWIPVVPLSLPRRALVDDHYEGYFIPKGTLILANVWHILRDPQEYPDPDRFYPDRFMKDGALNSDVRDPNTVAFGFGRRICPGRHLAKDNAFLTMASVLHVFDIIPAVDEHGKQLDPTVQMTTGLLSYPDRLNYTVRARSEAAERLIHATA
ncbi:CyP450 monooxygenase [Irpex rosettiformis]|uniref:CyP450 monooxygenase n=1 Tax=Irpex rosettiformis TaxID=378272 RepID=A0ACB8UDM4_9APHY|nr:CyP450 monooxygenase [Irpex rosettiformis]